MLSLEELQNLARQQQRDDRAIRVMQSTIPKPRRAAPAPPTPMAPLTKETVAKTLASVDSHAARLFIVLSDTAKDEFGVIRIERRELAERMNLGVTTIAGATSTLRRNGLIQRIGRTGYVLRQR